MALFVDDAAMDLPSKYYPAIGSFLFQYAQLEYQLHEIIWSALALPYTAGRVLTIGTDVKVLCAMITTITSDNPHAAWTISRTHRQEMNSIAGHARKIYGLRNTVAHGTWQHPPGKPQQVRLHSMKEHDVRIMPTINKEVDDAHLHKKAGELRALNVRAFRLIKELNSLNLERQIQQQQSC